MGQGVPSLGKVLAGSREPDVGLPGWELLSLLLVELAAGDPSRWFQEKALPPDLSLGSWGCRVVRQTAAAGVTEEVCHEPLSFSKNFCLLHRPKRGLRGI